MKTNTEITKERHLTPRINGITRYSLRKDLGFWHLTFAGEEAVFKHERGADYVAYLLLNPPGEPIHALDLATQLSVPTV